MLFGKFYKLINLTMGYNLKEFLLADSKNFKNLSGGG